MPLSHLEHYLVCSDDIEKTRAWYTSVLGLREGWHPEVNFPAAWMYLGEVDIVHIAPSAKSAGTNQKAYLGRTSEDVGTGTGALDHIAFRATGLTEMKSHLEGMGVDFTERRANGQALYQLFLFDPNGIKVELNFDAAEAVGHKPGLSADEFERQT